MRLLKPKNPINREKIMGATSTPQERLFVVQQAYRVAYAGHEADLQQATTSGQVKKILANLEALEIAYYEAGVSALATTGKDVENAYKSAVETAKKTKAAYDEAKDLATRLRLASKLVDAIGALMVLL
jgi:hypothetical protein